MKNHIALGGLFLILAASVGAQIPNIDALPAPPNPAKGVFSPDGARIAVPEGNVVKVRVSRTLQELLTLEGHTEGVAAIAWARDVPRIVTGSYDNSAILWDSTTGELIRRMTSYDVLLGNDANRVWVSPSADLVYSHNTSGGYLRIFDGNTGALRQVVLTSTLLGVDSNGELVQVGWSTAVELWRTTPGLAIRTYLLGHPGRPTLMAAGGGTDLFTADSTGWIFWWDSSTGVRLGMSYLPYATPLSLVQLQTGRGVVITDVKGDTYLWRNPLDPPVKSPVTGAVNASLSGNEVVAITSHASVAWGQPEAAAPGGELIPTTAHHVAGLAFDLAKQTDELAILASPDWVYVVRGDSLAIRSAYRLPAPTATNEIAIRADGGQIAVVPKDGPGVTLLDTATGATTTVPAGFTTNPIRIEYTSTGEVVAVGGQRIVVLDPQGQLLHERQLEAASISALAVSKDGQRYVVYTSDGEYRMAEWRTGVDYPPISQQAPRAITPGDDPGHLYALGCRSLTRLDFSLTGTIAQPSRSVTECSGKRLLLASLNQTMVVADKTPTEYRLNSVGKRQTYGPSSAFVAGLELSGDERRLYVLHEGRGISVYPFGNVAGSPVDAVDRILEKNLEPAGTYDRTVDGVLDAADLAP